MFLKTAYLALILSCTVNSALQEQPDPIHMIQDLRSGKSTDNTLQEQAFWLVCDYLFEHNQFKKKNDIQLIHELGIIYRKTNHARHELAYHKQHFGAEASEQTTTLIRHCLEKSGCPLLDVPIYQLKNGVIDNATGLTNAQGIWINEDLIGDDFIEFERTCTHEAGHWYYLHGLWPMVIDSYTRAEQEFDADEFGFKHLSLETRKHILARAEQRLNPKDYHHNKELREKLRPEMRKTSSGIEYSLSVPAEEHCRNILTIARTMQG